MENDQNCALSSKEDYCHLISLAHESRIKEAHLQRSKDDIKVLEKEVEKLRLETKWCFDEQGQRSVSAAEQVAIGISEKIMQHPQLMEDIVKALQMKKLDLLSNLSTLQQKCKDLSQAKH